MRKASRPAVRRALPSGIVRHRPASCGGGRLRGVVCGEGRTAGRRACREPSVSGSGVRAEGFAVLRLVPCRSGGVSWWVNPSEAAVLRGADSARNPDGMAAGGAPHRSCTAGAAMDEGRLGGDLRFYDRRRGGGRGASGTSETARRMRAGRRRIVRGVPSCERE